MRNRSLEGDTALAAYFYISPPPPAMTASYVVHLLELRLKAQGNPHARAIIDRCLQLIARAAEEPNDPASDPFAEVRQIADDLALRYGPPRTAKRH